VVRGAVGEDQTCCNVEGHSFGNRDAGARIGDRLLGETAAQCRGDHGISRLEPCHTFADGIDDARNLEAGREGAGRTNLVLVFDDEGIGVIDAAEAHDDTHLTAAGRRLGHLAQNERIGAAGEFTE